MNNQFTRLELLVGQEAISKLKDKTIAIFGIGGVGGNSVDALARSGFKNFVLIDNDVVSLTNLNRQYVANLNTLGKLKTEIMREHILSISPDAKIEIVNKFMTPFDIENFDFSHIDFVVDAIDSVPTKVSLIKKCYFQNIPIISALGCGNRLDPLKLTVTDIYKTEGDPLAKVLRKELKEQKVKKLRVVYSTELPIKPDESLMSECIKEEQSGKKFIPGSSSFVPPAAGIIIASEVFKYFVKN